MAKQLKPAWHPVSIAHKTQFPRIYRTITESRDLRDPRIWGLGLLFVFLVLFIAAGVRAYAVARQAEILRNERQKTEIHKQYWEGVVRKYPDYRDAYYNVAVLSYKLKDIPQAQAYLTQVLVLDPNFTPAKTLQKRITVGL